MIETCGMGTYAAGMPKCDIAGMPKLFHMIEDELKANESLPYVGGHQDGYTCETCGFVFPENLNEFYTSLGIGKASQFGGATHFKQGLLKCPECGYSAVIKEIS